MRRNTIRAMRDAEILEASDEGTSIINARWKARVKYKGRRAEIFHFEEFHNLGGIMEVGPSFFKVTKITVRLARKP